MKSKLHSQDPYSVVRVKEQGQKQDLKRRRVERVAGGGWNLLRMDFFRSAQLVARAKELEVSLC